MTAHFRTAAQPDWTHYQSQPLMDFFDRLQGVFVTATTLGVVEYMHEVNRTTPHFYADPAKVPRTKEFCQLKTFVYSHLNFFEEIYQATQRSSWIAKQFESADWYEYIFRKLRHPLMKEVFVRESKTMYSGKFREFIEAHRSRIDQPPDPHAF